MLPVKRILCPVDFSAGSIAALRHAAVLASCLSCEVVLVHVHLRAAPVAVRTTRVRGAGWAPAPPSREERDGLADSLRVLVEAEAPDLRNVTWHLDESADVPGAVLARAATLRPELIVLGTHGRAGLDGEALGSVTERILRTAPCAVLAVPPAARLADRRPPRIGRVVCALDFSDASLRALECATVIAAYCGAPLTAAHIVELPPPIPGRPHSDLSIYRAARFEQAHAAMQSALAGVVGRHASIDDLLLAGRPGPEVLRLAAEQCADLVVMGMQGHDEIGCVLFGSVVQHVVRRASCPVLTVPAAKL